MDKIKHKKLGEGTIIERRGTIVAVKYDIDGSVVKYTMPGSFTTGVFELEGDFKKEVEAAVNAVAEKKRLEREANAAARKSATVAAEATKSSSKSSRKASKTSAKSTAKHATEQAYYDYLIKSGYKEETGKGADSTAPTYVKKVKAVLGRENLTWSQLETEIPNIVKKYDVGGTEEDYGHNSKDTVINALRRFKDFVDNSDITATATISTESESE
jgi:hypothetical protein